MRNLLRSDRLLPISLLLFLISTTLSAQTREQRSLLREGNTFYDKSDFKTAQMRYQSALNLDTKDFPSNIGLGDAMYQNKDYEKSRNYFENAAINGRNKEEIASAWHNQGNSFLKEKKYEESIAAYKKALKNNPSDKDTKYNLSYALEKLKEKNKQNKNNKDKKDQKKDDKKDGDKKDQNQKNQDKKGDKQDKQNQPKEGDKKDDKGKGGQSKDEQDKKQGKMQALKLSQEDAERILNALKNEEQKTQRKMMLKNKKKEDRKNIEKQW